MALFRLSPRRAPKRMRPKMQTLYAALTERIGDWMLTVLDTDD